MRMAEVPHASEMNGDRKRQEISGLRCKQVIHHLSGHKACKEGTLSADGCVML